MTEPANRAARLAAASVLLDGKLNFQTTAIPRPGIEIFGERIQKLLLAGIFGAHGHVALIAPFSDGLSDREADDLLQWNVLSRRQFLCLFEHRLRDLGFNSYHGIPSCLRAKSAHKIDNQADEQKETNSAAADYRPPEIKPATTEHQKKNQQNN
jgi:hypothetical protein